MARKLPLGNEPLEGKQLIDQMADTPLLSHAEEVELGHLLLLLRERIATCTDPRELETLKYQYKNARDRMFYANIRLVLEIANKMHRLEYMEQVQYGATGLWRATDLFDVKRGNRFSTYATWWIRQAIMRGADEMDSTIRLPVHVRDVLRDIRKAENIFFQEVGREPTPEILARLTGHSVEKIKRVIAFLESPKSLDERLSLDDEDGHEREYFVEDHNAHTEKEYVEQDAETRLKAIIHEALCKLEAHIPEGETRPKYVRHARVLRLRYRIGEPGPTSEDAAVRTLEQVGTEMGITRERARQLQKDAVKWMRANCPELRALLDHINGEEENGGE